VVVEFVTLDGVMQSLGGPHDHLALQEGGLVTFAVSDSDFDGRLSDSFVERHDVVGHGVQRGISVDAA